MLIKKEGFDMKKIVCYGDSNTFGYNPKDASRFDENTRWTSILQDILKNEYEIINAGMCDRTGFVNNPNGFEFSAPQHFPDFISKSENIDILILWIGTNDLQFQYDINVDEIQNGLEELIKLAKTKSKKVVIILPVELDERILQGYFRCQFDETSVEKSKIVGKFYKTLANIYGCEIFDVNEFVKPSDTDGLHYDKNSHKIIANKLADFISRLKFD